jgi:isopenicillin N synthase-like dioxygenase
MNSWGLQLKNCNLVVAEMAAIGFGLDQNAFTDKVMNGDYYLSPTGIDLNKTVPGQVLTGFHHDYDFLTVHGKCRYGGLYAWMSTGEKFRVEVPDGHLLVQAGKQLEWLTGGHVKAGFHEVIHNEQVEAMKQQVVRAGGWPWRVASVVFCQV